MGIRIFGSSSVYDDMGVRSFVKYQVGNFPSDSGRRTLPNPDPNNYEFVKVEQVGNHLVVTIRYPDCTNYEGNKILLYQSTSINDLLRQKVIDPHFAQNKEFRSPFARFEPTEAGWAAAILLAQALKF